MKFSKITTQGKARSKAEEQILRDVTKRTWHSELEFVAYVK